MYLIHVDIYPIYVEKNHDKSLKSAKPVLVNLRSFDHQ